MPVAIAFSGLPRIKTHALESWQRLCKKHRCHVFFHVWQTDHAAINHLVSLFSPLMCRVETPRIFDVSNYQDRLVSSDPYSVFSMWTGINESISMAINSGIDYGRIIRARFDVAFDDFDFLDSHGVVIPGKAAEIYEFQGLRYPGWHDMMAYGDPISMKTYADTLNAISGIYQEGSPFFSEFFLSTHLFRSKMAVTHHAVYADIVR
jgi:hypothetical protein